MTGTAMLLMMIIFPGIFFCMYPLIQSLVFSCWFLVLLYIVAPFGIAYLTSRQK